MATTSSTHGTGVLRLERRFAASPERVFQAWTSSEELSRWCAPPPATSVVDADVRVGGHYRIVMSAPDGSEYRVGGVYREIDPPRRLVFTWQWENMPDFPETLVTMELRAREDGGTDLLLVHERLPNDESGEQHREGWVACFEKLAGVVEAHGA
jgi:uncharacterized protein YndB with AHSA1/START domain